MVDPQPSDRYILEDQKTTFNYYHHHHHFWLRFLMIIFSSGFQSTLKNLVWFLKGPAEVGKGKDVQFPISRDQGSLKSPPCNLNSSIFICTVCQSSIQYVEKVFGCYSILGKPLIEFTPLIFPNEQMSSMVPCLHLPQVIEVGGRACCPPNLQVFLSSETIDTSITKLISPFFSYFPC